MVKKTKRYDFNPKLLQEIAKKKATHKNQIVNEIEQIMFRWDPGNFTCCPECHCDDFCHIEGCKYAEDDILSRLADYVVKRENGKEKNL